MQRGLQDVSASIVNVCQVASVKSKWVDVRCWKAGRSQSSPRRHTDPSQGAIGPQTSSLLLRYITAAALSIQYAISSITSVYPRRAIRPSRSVFNARTSDKTHPVGGGRDCQPKVPGIAMSRSECYRVEMDFGASFPLRSLPQLCPNLVPTNSHARSDPRDAERTASPFRLKSRRPQNLG